MPVSPGYWKVFYFPEKWFLVKIIAMARSLLYVGDDSFVFLVQQ